MNSSKRQRVLTKQQRVRLEQPFPHYFNPDNYFIIETNLSYKQIMHYFYSTKRLYRVENYI